MEQTKLILIFPSICEQLLLDYTQIMNSTSTERSFNLIVNAMEAHPFYSKVWMTESGWEEVFYRLELIEFQGQNNDYLSHDEWNEWVEDNYEHPTSLLINPTDKFINYLDEYKNTN